MPIYQDSGIPTGRYDYREPKESMTKSEAKSIVLLIKLHEFGTKLASNIPYTVLEIELFDGWYTICFTEIVKTRKYEANFYWCNFFAQALSFTISR